jgi:hypothetical protein
MLVSVIRQKENRALQETCGAGVPPALLAHRSSGSRDGRTTNVPRFGREPKIAKSLGFSGFGHGRKVGFSLGGLRPTPQFPAFHTQTWKSPAPYSIIFNGQSIARHGNSMTCNRAGEPSLPLGTAVSPRSPAARKLQIRSFFGKMA